MNDNEEIQQLISRKDVFEILKKHQNDSNWLHNKWKIGDIIEEIDELPIHNLW